MKNVKNNVLFFFYTIILGIIVGLIVWAFLYFMNLGIDFLWGFVPAHIDFSFYTICVCTAGGFLIGLWKKRFGDYPEELQVVLGRVKKTGRYPYSNVFSILVSAILPLLTGASVGPEAGLTGVIAGLCTWVGDKLKRFKREVEELTSIGLSATLGTIFRSPMFGFMEPLESEKDTVLPKTSKIVLYFTAILSSFGIFILMNMLVGKEKMEGAGTDDSSAVKYLYAVPLAAVGILAGYIFFLFKKLTSFLKHKFEKYVIIRATAGGIILGIAGTFIPLSMFSGEHQISQVMETMESIGIAMLLVIAVVKLLLTNICIDSGLKGGHFFPVIFCGVCIGCAMSMITGLNPVYCAAVVTTALVGHTLKKPLATVLLLMIVFPFNLVPVMLAAAMLAKFIPTPKFLIQNH